MPALRRVLIFDLDGTLVDSMQPYTDLFCEMLRDECGIPEAVSLPVYTRLLGKGPRAQFGAVLRQVEAWSEALVRDLTRRYWLRAEVGTPALFPEVLDVLQTLRDEGHGLVISSGGIPASVDRKTGAAGLDGLFRLVLGSEEDNPARSKGAGHFALIAAALAITPSDLQARGAFVGDGVYDMQIAREAGITGIGRRTGDNADALLAAGARHVITDLRELPPIIAAG